MMKLAPKLKALLGDGYFRAGATAIHYGSRREGRDIDLTLVQPEEPRSPGVQLGRLDLFLVSYARFDALLSVLDPNVVEPIATGTVVLGDQDWFAGLGRALPARRSDSTCVEHALLSSIRAFEYSASHLAGYRAGGERRCLTMARTDLSFSISYASFAKRYARVGAAPCTLRELAGAGQLLAGGFWEYFEEQKDNTPDPRELEGWLVAWERELPETLKRIGVRGFE